MSSISSYYQPRSVAQMHQMVWQGDKPVVVYLASLALSCADYYRWQAARPSQPARNIVLHMRNKARNFQCCDVVLASGASVKSSTERNWPNLVSRC